jgi:hypothetical protein
MFTPKNANSKVSESWFSKNASANTNANSSSLSLVVIVGILLIGVIAAVYYYFRNELTDTWNSAIEIINGYFNPPPPPPPAPAPEVKDEHGHAPQPTDVDNNVASATVNKILPGNEVFNVSSNRYTYYDAEPLCKALGAELATYDQVKDAWNKGADWCNYGWVKGQMAVYPTSDETYKKIQAGPEDQRMACGRPGMNGGYFDNPEMRFGVTCVGNKPAQSKHDEDAAANGAPLSPDALAFDKKVSKFKSEADHIRLLPFSTGKWTS